MTESTSSCLTRKSPPSRSITIEMSGQRRFPAPWRAEKMPGGYVVRDANDQALAYVYSRSNPAEALQAKVLTEDEARRAAANMPSSFCIHLETYSATRNRIRCMAVP